MDKVFGLVWVDFKLIYQKICEYYVQYLDVQVVIGFVVFVKGGLMIMLGCGGLDYIVVLIVVGFDVSVIEIWIDVDGVFMVDF